VRGFAAVSSGTVACDTAGRVRSAGPTGSRRRRGFTSPREEGGAGRQEACQTARRRPAPQRWVRLAPCRCRRVSAALSRRARKGAGQDLPGPSRTRFLLGPGGSSGELEAVRTAGHTPERSGSLRGRVPVLIPKVPVGSVLGAPCAAARLAATDPLANQVNTLPNIGADCQIAINLSRRVLREHSRLGLIVNALRHETRIAVER